MKVRFSLVLEWKPKVYAGFQFRQGFSLYRISV